MEDQESLQAGAVVRNPSNLVQNLINEFLAHGVMSTGVVIGRILLASDHLLGMEEATVGTGTNFIDDIGFEISVDGTRNVFSLAWKMLALWWIAENRDRLASLGEEGAEAMIIVGGLSLFGEVSIGLLTRKS
jgi:hypothetical protein